MPTIVNANHTYESSNPQSNLVSGTFSLTCSPGYAMVESWGAVTATEATCTSDTAAGWTKWIYTNNVVGWRYKVGQLFGEHTGTKKLLGYSVNTE